MGSLKLGLDLFCGAGGASVGYTRAGFTMIGVDINPMPRYPYEFHQRDALEVLRNRKVVNQFAFIHASPPCQAYTTLNAYNHVEYPDYVAEVRELLHTYDVPWVIENVPGAPLKNPGMLCGPMFNLKLYRHRLFETSWVAWSIPPHEYHWELCARNGYLPTPERPYMSIHGGKHSRAWLLKAAEYMDVPWMVGSSTKASIRDVCESIPPAYTEYVGKAIPR